MSEPIAERPTTGTEPVRSLWWLNPLTILAIVSGSTVIWAVQMPREQFRLYNTPKYIDDSFITLAAIGVLAAVVGGVIVYLLPEPKGTSIGKNYGMWLRCFWICIWLTYAAYAVWLLVGIKNGFRPGMILDFIRMNDELEGFAFKNRIFPTVPGVTTLTQCALIAVMIGVTPNLRHERGVLLATASVVFMAFFRGLLLSERLAFLELVLCGGLVWLRSDVLPRLSHWFAARAAFRLAPIVGPVFLLVLFGSFEYFRSYQFYQNRFSNIAEFTIWRISAYYTLGHNNSAMIYKLRGQWPLPYYSISAVWTFPLVKYSPLAYHKLTGMSVPDSYNQMLRLHAAEEYNNEGGLFSPLFDFGLSGYVLFWMVFGAVSIWSYRAYLRADGLSLLVYPILYLTILETPRYLYLGLSRATPALVIMVIMWILVARRSSSRASTLPVASPALT